MSGPPPVRSWAGPAAAAVIRRPWLWPTAVRQVRVLAPTGWWRRRPWLPLPDPAYLEFRMLTQYGDGNHAPAPDDVVTYRRWCGWFRAFTQAR
ncbi:MAG: hypothetical protein NVSMB12_16380 [Acidimicrobiales bacterium]